MAHMKQLSLAGISALALIVSAPQPAQAVDYLSGYAGWFDISQQDDEAAQVGMEYRFSPWEYGIRPMIGANITTDGSIYGYGGLDWDIPVVDNQWYIIPNFAAGGYAQGDGKDLGSGIEFRSGIELDYQFPTMQRVGIAFNHISNASIGDKNPGAETVLINYSVPMGR
jgi:lipid A 3-O-deacylase